MKRRQPATRTSPARSRCSATSTLMVSPKCWNYTWVRTPPAPPRGTGAWFPCHPGIQPSSSPPPLVRPSHVFTPARSGALPPGVQWCGHVGARHPITSRGNTLRASILVSPHVVLPQRHAAHLPHPPRTPPCRPPDLTAQPCLHHGHVPYPWQSPGANGRVPTPTPPEVGPRRTPRPP